MDGLSVAASVAGLLQISTKVISFVSTIADAPSIARSVSDEVIALNIIFRQLEDFISGLMKGKPGRGSMLLVDQLVTALTGCVCAFTELEHELEGLESDSVSLWDRARWAQKDSNLRRIVGDLEKSKSSLNLMLTIHTWFVATVFTDLET